MKHLSYDDKNDRSVLFAEFIVENRSTVRAAAKHFKISKSTVHMDRTKQKMY